MLGWILAGISNHPELGSDWVFKGGTCLKKCYFETYRFSEDLDFTITNPDNLNEEFLKNAFREIAGWVYETTGIGIPTDTIRFEIYKNPRGAISAEGRISYRGPMQPRGDLPRIKLGITNDEKLINRDKASLDIFWLKDESLEDSDNLPKPNVIAKEIVEDLQDALVQFLAIAEDLGEEEKL